MLVRDTVDLDETTFLGDPGYVLGTLREDGLFILIYARVQLNWPKPQVVLLPTPVNSPITSQGRSCAISP